MKMDINRQNKSLTRGAFKQCSPLPLFYFFPLLFSLLISACPSPLETSREELPEGFGSFSLIVENGSRTILPTAPTTGSFAAYTLAFTATSGGTSKSEDRTNATLATSPVILAVGTYSLTVSAYLDAGKTRLAARGTETGIVIGSGANVSQTVSLKTLSDTGSGTFSYNVTISAPNVTGAEMAITKNGAAISGSPVTLNNTGATSASLPLAVGVYNIRFTLIKGGAVKEEAVWNEILHVHAELTSNFTKTFDNDYFYRTHYNVTFVYNDGATANTPQSVMHGGTLTTPTPTRTGYGFEGWHTDSGLTTAYVSAPVDKDFTLYAKWKEGPTGTGTSDDPFLVTNETELRYVGKGDDNPDLYKTWTLTAHYEQTANIDLTGKDVWTAIGRDGPPYDGSARFTGTYNGGGHTIKGLTLNPTLQYQGMFGYIGAGGTVENLGLIDVNITCNASAGGIAGRSEGTIQNCYVTGSVTGSDFSIGGIAGETGYTNAIIKNCYFIGSVTGTRDVGGIIGYNNYGTIQNCYVSGNVTGARDVGGIAGGNANGGTIQNCYASGSVTATEMLYDYNGVGGIVGLYSGNTGGNIRNCIALNEIITITGTGTYTNIGRVLGNNRNNGPMQNNYAWSGMKLWVYGSRVSASADGKNGESITAANAKTSATWTTAGRWNTGGIGVWNFDDVWQWNGTSGMPSLRGVGGVQPWPPHLDFDPGVSPADPGSGSSSNPFKVWNEETLRYVGRGTSNPPGYTGWTLTAYYEQTANITLTQGEWTRIGSGYNTSSFTGSYNGGGHTITGLTIIVTADNQGMFGYIGTGGKVENLALINVDINGTGNYIGGIAGVNSGGTIQNCYVSGSITAGYVLGGIAGNHDGTIQNCYFTGDVEGGSNIGGIAGQNYGTIQNCYAIGSVTSQNSVGGIAGSGGQSIQNCVALNESVTTQYTNTSIGRVFGSSSTGTFQNNHAWSGMTVTVTGGGTYTPDATAGGKDGVSITAANAKNNSWWSATTWDFTTVWQLNGANGMPSLRVFGNTVPPWPGYLVDPPTIGDTGPGGGKIFYYNPAGFTVQMADPAQNYTAHYLEAAPNDMATTLTWGSSSYTSTNSTAEGIGEGRKNTALILATDANAPAAKACADAVYGGKTDWFLPSKDELNQLYVNRTSVGNMGTVYYWSSSQFTIYLAWLQRFSDGNQNNNGDEFSTNSVRAVRAF
jgi:uncharacterized repeat protein (TIGR02543 family)